MPGIFGCVNRNCEPVSEEISVAMADSLKHSDLYTCKLMVDSCALGIVEHTFLQNKSNLAHNKIKSLICVFRGNIYNKQDLSKKFSIDSTSSDLNDAQFIIDLFALKGLDFVKYINGPFNVAICDKEADKLIIANDRYGTYPMFYSLNEKMFIFASEAKGVLKGAKAPPPINKVAIPEFFTFSFLLGDKTFFQGVKYMSPASILVYGRSKDHLEQKQYWGFSKGAANVFRSQSYESYLKAFEGLARKAVERSVQDKEKIGVFLSGGLDSRVIAAFASQTGKEVITFTFGVKGCIQKRIAEAVSQRLGLRNVFYEIPSNFIAQYSGDIIFKGDGLVRIRDCHFIGMLENVRKEVDTVLLGIYGILFGWQRWEHPKRFFNKECKLSSKDLANYLIKRYNTVLPLLDYKKAFTNSFYEEIEGVVQKNFMQTVDQRDFDHTVARITHWVIRNSEPRYIFQNLQYINWYLETRYPFSDNEVVDFFAFTLPPELKARKLFLQNALNYCFPSLSDIPIEHGGAAPGASLMRFLVGEFTASLKRRCTKTLERLLSHRPLSLFEADDYRDYDHWLRTGSRAYVEKVLLDPTTLNRGYFRSDYIKRIVEEHMTGKRNHDQMICDLVNLELMFRIFFDTN